MSHTSVPVNTPSMKVLLAEDSPAAQKILLNALDSEGYEAECYANGAEAFEAILRPGSPDLIILDWTMPGMSGLEICEKLVQAGLNEHKYILILSATSDKNSIAHILRAGANDYVTKPMNREELLARLKVARRQLDLIQELRARTEELRTYIRKHRMLKFFTQSSDNPPSSKTRDLPETYLATSSKEPSMRKALAVQEVRHFEKTFFKVLEQCKLGATLAGEDVLKNTDNDKSRAKLMAWNGLYLPQSEVWLDLIFETPFSAAESIAQHSLSKGLVSETETKDLFSELISLTSDAMKQRLQEAGMEIEAFYLPRAFLIKNRSALLHGIPHWITWHLHLIDAPARLHLLPCDARTERMEAGKLAPDFILMQDICPPGHAENILLHKHTRLSRSNLKYIDRWSNFNAIDNHFDVLRPSSLAARVLALLERIDKG